jgi:SAM-dependent methyltransferase
VLELGVGTGRLAIPLAAAGVDVTGVDASAAMLDRLAGKDGAQRVDVVRGDMVDDLPAGTFALVFVAYNTLFNLLTAERQQQCFAAVAERLTPDGVFVVEAFVPLPQPGPEVAVRSLEADRVVLTVSVRDDTNQKAEGHFVELTELGGVRLRPWSIRYAPPAELDEMASAAALVLRDRWEGFDRAPFTPDSERHVSVYCRAERGA